jgi:hypothetical protein
MRLFELAKDLSTTNRQLIEVGRDLGMTISNHMMQLSDEDVVDLRREFDLKQRAD